MSADRPWLALVALGEERLPSPPSVAEQLAERFGDAPPLVVTSETERGVTFSWGGASGNYTLVDREIPWSKLEGPCATAWYWPEAEAAMRSHTAHLFVTLLDENSNRVDGATRMTQLVTALCAVTNPVGLVWGPSGQVHNPVDFAVMAGRMSRDDLPLHLWIDFRVTQRDDDEGFALFTTGLEPLGHRELEVPRYAGEAQELAGAVYNVAHYVLEKGPVLKDGEAVGLPGGGQVNVRYEPSMIDEEQEVIRLEFE